MLTYRGLQAAGGFEVEFSAPSHINNHLQLNRTYGKHQRQEDGEEEEDEESEDVAGSSSRKAVKKNLEKSTK